MATLSSGRQSRTLCFFYEKGSCRSGASCRFTHGTSDNRELVGNSAAGGPGKAPQARSPIWSTKGRCKYFAKGGGGGSGSTDGNGNTANQKGRPRGATTAAAADGDGDDDRAPPLTAAKRPAPGDTPDSAHPCPSPRRKHSAAAAGKRAGSLRSTERGVAPAALIGEVFLATRPGILTTTGETGPSSSSFTSSSSVGGSSSGGSNTRGLVGSRAGLFIRRSPTDYASTASYTSTEDYFDDDDDTRAPPHHAATKAANERAKKKLARAAAASTAGTAADAASASVPRGALLAQQRGRLVGSGGVERRREVQASLRVSSPRAVQVRRPLQVKREKSKQTDHGGGEHEKLVSTESALDESKRNQSRSAECGICLESVRKLGQGKKRLFGVLVGCKHGYCIGCIREWRAKSKSDECPECRVLSPFVIPSKTLVTDPERKKRLVLEFLKSLNRL